MALVLKDRVRETSTTIGTGTITLAGAVSGFQSFSNIGNGNTTYYTIAGGTEWEVGLGTYTSLNNTLSRDTVLSSSNGNSLVNFSAGTKDVFVTYPAEKGIYLNANGNSIGLGTPASATLTNATGLPLSTGVTGTLPIANGGTGTTSTTFTNLTTNVTGTLPVANGGTGITSLGTGVATFLGTPSSSNLASAVTDETGSGSLVFATSPTLTTPILGTPSSGTLTSCTGLPISTGVSGLGTNVATALAVNVGSSGAFVTNGGALGTPSSGTVTNLTGTASININGTVGATTATTGAFTTLSASDVATFSAGTATAPAITTTGDTNTGMFFPAADTIAFTEGGTEAMRLDSFGNVGIGTASPSAKLQVNAENFALSTSYSTLTSNLAVRTTTAQAANVGGEIALGGYNAGSSISDFVRLHGKKTNSTSGNVSGYFAVEVSDDTGPAPYMFERMRIDSDGYLIVPKAYSATTGSAANVHVLSSGAFLRSTSSIKYKTDVQNAVHGLDKVMELRPVTYKGINDGDIVFGGLIAEEVHDAGLTEFVQYAENGTPDALAYGNMVSLLTKAIQEQQTIINELKSRIETLEAK